MARPTRTSETFQKVADCVSKSGGTVKKGYDGTSSQTFQVRAVTKGRVVRWSGGGKDSFVPNAVGRKQHCSAGAYHYTLSGVAQ